jgi:hypothetical protein
MSGTTMHLYHYYEKETGPFNNLSELPLEKAQIVLNGIKKENPTFAAQRYDGYLERRAELEQLARDIFISKGGKPTRQVPQYMVVEACDWLRDWYHQGEYIKIPITDFTPDTISFSYGDMFPTFSPRVTDNKEYRRQIYTYKEILDIIDRYGFPQEWNKNGTYGPERYIEVQVWSDEPVSIYYIRSKQDSKVNIML